MKDNVYLIDFNIANMFNMIANSAKMKAAAEGDPRPETIKKFMKDDLGTTPITQIFSSPQKKDSISITNNNNNNLFFNNVNNNNGIFKKN